MENNVIKILDLNFDLREVKVKKVNSKWLRLGVKLITFYLDVEQNNPVLPTQISYIQGTNYFYDKLYESISSRG